MYMIYIDGVLFPVAPDKITTELESDNKMYTLIDGSRVSQPGGKGLKKISFDLLLPMSPYPFANYENGFCRGEYYIDHLSLAASKNQPVTLDVYRTYNGGADVYLTSVKVLVEKVTVTEDAENGADMIASVVLREYRHVESIIARERTNTYQAREDDYTIPDTYTVKAGDSLWSISKKVFGDGSKYIYLAEINGIKKPYTIYKGQVLKLKE